MQYGQLSFKEVVYTYNLVETVDVEHVMPVDSDHDPVRHTEIVSSGEHNFCGWQSHNI